MATTFVFDRGSQYGESEFLGSLCEGCDFTPEQEEELRDRYIAKVREILADYDPSLYWWPSLSEVWGEAGVTETDPADFREWWNDPYSNRWEKALEDVLDELQEEIDAVQAQLDEILVKAAWWEADGQVHRGEWGPGREYPFWCVYPGRRQGVNLQMLDDGDLVKLYDIAPDYGWLMAERYDGDSIAYEIMDRVNNDEDDESADALDRAVEVLRQRMEDDTDAD